MRIIILLRELMFTQDVQPCLLSVRVPGAADPYEGHKGLEKGNEMQIRWDDFRTLG